MRKKILLISVFSLLTLMTASAVQAAWIWSPESGKWTNPKNAAKDTPEAQYLFSMQYFDTADYKRAVDEFDKLIKTFPQSKWAAEAQFHIGVCQERMGDIGKASEAFKNMIDRYPYSERLNDAVEHQFELAEAMLDGKKTKFLGMAILPAQDTAAELYQHIVRSAPYGPYGAVAQYRLGDAYTALAQYEEAERAYQAVIDEYPNSEYAPKAKYKIAETSYKAATKEEYRSEKTDEALQKYEGFKKAFPQSGLQYEADEAIQALREKKARQILTTADFYDRRGKLKSARMYYDDVVRSFPETAAGKEAEARIPQIDALLEKGDTRPGVVSKVLNVVGLNKDKKEATVAEKLEEKQAQAPEAPKRKKFLGIL
jgi:outer membrane protein assembly factor BamD